MHPISLRSLQSLPLTIYSTRTTKLQNQPTSNLLPIRVPLFSSIKPLTRSGNLCLNCSSEENGAPRTAKDLISGMVDERVGELLNREENRSLFQGLEEATRRVEIARKELADIERQEAEATRLKDYVRQIESRASEIAECQRELSGARAMVEEAERSLSSNMNEISSGDALNNNGSEVIDRNKERWESVKAAFISSVVGTLAGFPMSFSQVTSSAQLFFQIGVIFISCALFGVTFRYTIRSDLDNIQLKTGTSAAFGFIKGLAELEAGPPLEFSSGSFLSHAVDGAVHVSANLLIFVFAAIGLDYCFKMRLLSPFPIRKSVSKTNLR